jgi:hypothetical protein
MPTNYIKKLAKEGKGSVESLEKKWDEAKSAANKEGKGSNFAYTTSIFNKMIGASIQPFRIEAAQRIEASAKVEVHADDFEGWINTLGYKYERTEGEESAILDAPLSAVWNKLKTLDWESIRTPNGLQKGDHVIRVTKAGEHTRIVSLK